ncbi:SKT5 protein [Plectosphaerella cucumerina]|uniref:SKT5 protein n=1 Tax=Plectosphaerella cucumerina TaxID=40658 RepID=A0A8K0TGP0_9PEZI|nr:SKT5 protein [Plectosphaerella cucumerina]
MAYQQQGGYGAQRPYQGPPPGQRMPPPRDPYHPGPSQQQYGGQQQQYDNHQDGYSQDQYGDGGYAQDYGGQYQADGYGRPPPNRGYPPQDQYGPGPGQGGRPPPMARPPTADSARGPAPRGGHPPPGRGPPGGGPRPGPYDRAPNSDPLANRHDGFQSPTSPQGFGNPYPGFPGQTRRPNFEQDRQLADQLAGMDISIGVGQQSRPPNDARGPPQRYNDDYQEKPRAGPGGARPFGADYRTDGPASRGPPPRDDFGPPGRSMTMPAHNGDPMAPPAARGHPGPPQRTGTMPIQGMQGRDAPQRPSTASGHRQPPQRSYPPQMGYNDGYGGGDQGYAIQESNEPADPYYAPSRMSNPEFARGTPSLHSDHGHNYDGPGVARGSFDHMQPQAGPIRHPDLSRTKSQPDLRQPQAAVFEMASDAPPMPPMDVTRHGSLQGGYQDQNNNWDNRRPSGPPAPVRPGLPTGPSPSRNSNPDSLPSHPTPVRPGHMPGSMVSVNDRPAPVRNYDGVSQNQAARGPQPQQQQAAPQRSSQASLAKAKIPVTPEELEHLRVVIKTDPNDQESALKLAKRLIEASDVLVPKLADPRSRGRARERYLADAHKILKKLSNAQNVDAMFVYADALGRGLFSAEPDNKEAFTWYQSAAKLGHASAAYRTAVCCEIGNEEGGGTRKDPLKAIQWYKRAATLGDTPAMYKMGMIMLKGLLGQNKNPREAISWLKRAAERADVDNPHALHELGLLYESAQPNDAYLRDEAYAFTLFRQAAELGYKFSQFRLGAAYEFGLMGCPIDPRQSILWYSKAAAQEEHQSELSLSGWYLTGSEGVLQQSDTEAYLWARKAAIAGLAKAEYAMGYFTEVGIGAPANMEDAKRWYWRAASQDFPKARERLEDLKRVGKTGPRQRERISRTKMGKQQEGE